MAFAHTHKEEQTHTKKSDWYSAEIGDYRVLIIMDDDVTRLSISPRNWNDGGRLAVFDCHPKSVAEIEHLAEAAPELFRAIAKEMRDSGFDDLRGKWGKMRDENEAAIERMVSQIENDAQVNQL